MTEHETVRPVLVRTRRKPTKTTEWGFDPLGTIADHGHADLIKVFAEADVPVTPKHLVQAQMTERLDALEDANLRTRCDIGHFEGDRAR